jgi:hypothetical protein
VEAPNYKVDFISEKELLQLSGGPVNVVNTIIVDVSNGAQLSFRLFGPNREIRRRPDRAMRYLQELFSFSESVPDHFRGPGTSTFLFQADDRPIDVKSVAWQTHAGFLNVVAVPDLYFCGAKGFVDLLPDHIPSWNQRIPKVLWRGSTTGAFNITENTIKDSLRYKLCEIGQSNDRMCDFAFFSVVQAASDMEKAKLEKSLRSRGLLKEFIPLEKWSERKYYLQIDGNASSWGIVGKLRLGCCPLFVSSPWRLWHDNALTAWKHYVPVAPDLSDLVEKIKWCESNDGKAETIAQEARSLALQLDFRAEMVAGLKAILRLCSGNS